MAIYVTHDIIDSRWRHRSGRIVWYWIYWVANIMFIAAFFVYFIAQVGGPDPDHKEAAAALVVMVVNTLSLMKIFRGLMAFQTTVILAQRFRLARSFQLRHSGPRPIRVMAINPLSVMRNSDGVTTSWNDLIENSMFFERSSQLRHSGVRHIRAYGEYVGDLVQKNASCLLDDDSPGDSARVAWWALVWAVLRRKPFHKCCVHRPGPESGFAHLSKVPVLQDANDLIIMAVAWVWGCLSQVCVKFSPAHFHPTPQVLLGLAALFWSTLDTVNNYRCCWRPVGCMLWEAADVMYCTLFC